MLVLVGVRSTAVSVCVVVVAVAGSFTTVVQEERAQTARTGTNKISFFISSLIADKPDSRQGGIPDGFEVIYLHPGDRHFAPTTAREVDGVENFHQVNRLLRVVDRWGSAPRRIDEILHL